MTNVVTTMPHPNCLCGNPETVKIRVYRSDKVKKNAYSRSTVYAVALFCSSHIINYSLTSDSLVSLISGKLTTDDAILFHQSRLSIYTSSHLISTTGIGVTAVDDKI